MALTMNGMNVCIPPNPYIEILASNVMVSGGRTSERGLGHEGGALLNEISAQRELAFVSQCEDTARRCSSMNQEAGPQQKLNLPTPWS